VALKSHRHSSIIGHAVDIALLYLSHHFSKHTNINAAYWCATFACKDLEESPFISEADIDAAEVWFKPWAIQMLLAHFKAQGIDRTEDDLKDKLDTQLDFFSKKSEGFAKLHKTIIDERQCA
jgi:hypothetical protein